MPFLTALPLAEIPPLLDQIKASPFAFLAGCVVWIPVFIWVYSMVSWTIMGEVDAIFGTASSGLAIVLGVMTSNPPDPRLAPLTFAAVLGMICLWPFIQMAANARIEHLSKLDEMERAYDRLENSPKDQGALFRLALALKKLNMTGPAIVMGETAVASLDRRYYTEYYELVEQWKADIFASEALKPTVCPACRLENGPGLPFCPRCGESQYLALAYQFWRPKSTGARLIGAWVTGVCAAVIIPLIAGSSWAAPVKILSIVGLSLIGGFVLIRTIMLLIKDRQI